ncbi:MAG TPA: response regulator [Planctomycetota bacterium]|nr:response regulator [Planctomycetota bacterium]
MNPSPVLLLVEDDPSDVLFLKRAFQKLGIPHPLHVAETGRKAMELLSGEGTAADRALHPAPTHLIMDLKLPEKSGLEVLEWIRSERTLRRLPVSILTSSKEERDVRRAKELGVDGYFVKPMSFALLIELAQILDHWVRTGEVSEELRWPSPTAIRTGP